MAQGTIPGSSLAIGGTSTIDAAGYFSDADGDELTYTGASSNEGVATVSMEGSSATITAVAAGDAVITITASDGSASASQGFTVTVAAAPANNPPVAVGTIPGSSLEIGGMSTIDAAGYFRDADGDELSYTGSSSNPGVATVAMEGSEATITAVTAGDAVITITASDGEASVSQGFRVDVNAGPKAATVVISRLLDANRQQIGDPTGISGTIYAVLDVQSNDETWNEIGLTLNGETVTPLCQGRTGGSSADAIAGPGLAAAGQVEIECQLNTNAVMGECVGMQLDPKYANGEYDLGAFLMTTTDERRDAVANQPIALDNHGFVKIAHMPGDQMEVGAHTAGLTFYGGPSVEGNVNMFHACPVAYDGTVVGKMRLSTKLTDTSQQDAAGTALNFREVRNGPLYPVKEAPFTWSASSVWNGMENVPDETETWILNDGQILDPNGLDVTATFRAGGMNAYAMYPAPLHFDFKAPTRTNESQVVIATSDDPVHVSWGPTTATHYIDGSGRTARRFRITDMTEMGVGHVYGVTSAIAVGDCGVGANADTRGSTAFVPLNDDAANVTLISQLPEEDPVADGVADGGGVDCYVAEVQSLADRLGNAVNLGRVARIRTASTFGVDRTAPEISRERPSESLVLSTNSLFFEVEEPRLATGEDGSGLTNNVVAWAGSSNRNSPQVYWSGTATVSGGSAMIDIDPTGNARFAREASHTVYATTGDLAGNDASTSFTFVRDQTAPDLSLSAVPSNFGSTTAKSVSVTVAGTLTDATEIRRAFLSIHHGATCTAADPLEATQVSGPVRRLDNGTNRIEFSEVFTVKQGDHVGPTDYCFFLTAVDDARDADDRAAANAYNQDPESTAHGDVISTFAVGWPAGPVVTPGPTFEFNTRATVSGVTTATAVEEFSVDEAATTDNVYYVTLKDAPSGATYPLEMMIDAPATVGTTMLSTASAAAGGTASSFQSVNDSVMVTVTTAHDLNNVSELRSLTHSATGFDDTAFPVTVTDDDFVISADVVSINEDDDAVEVAVTVEGAKPFGSQTTVTVDIAADAASGATAADLASGSAASAVLAFPGNVEVYTETVMIDAVDDAVRDEVGESIALTVSTSTEQGVYYEPASIMIVDDDPDVTLALDVTEVNEDAGTVTVEITATADEAVAGITTFGLALTGTATGGGTDYNGPSAITLTIDGGSTSGSTSVTLTIVEDGSDESNETIIFDDADGATVGTGATAKTYTVAPVTLTIIDNDDT